MGKWGADGRDRCPAGREEREPTPNRRASLVMVG